MFKQLHIKLTFYMGIILTIFMVFITTGIFYFTKYVYEEQTCKIMANEALKIQLYNRDVMATEEFFSDRNLLSLKDRIFMFGSEKLSSNYVSYDKSLNILHVKSEDAKLADSILNLAVESLNKKKDSFNKLKVDGVGYRVYTKYFETGNTQKVIQVYEDISAENYFWSFLKTVLWLMGVVGIFALLTISYVFTGKALKPVKESWQKQKEFIADASHELRTPLTVIQTNLDVMMSDEDGTIEENEIWLDNAYSETRVMANLIDQLLTLAKVDSNEAKLDLMEISLSEVVENVSDNMQIMAKNKNLNMVTDIKEDVIIRGDYDKIRRLVVILIDNAIKYTEEGNITIKVYTEKKQKILSVQDTGIGISDEDKKRIFDRFFRSDKARNRKFGGTGLGLSIAKWIVESHKASIDVEGKIGVGSTFIVKFY